MPRIKTTTTLTASTAVAFLALALNARAAELGNETENGKEPELVASAAAPSSASELLSASASHQGPFTFGAYAEVYYQWNFNNPSNGITNFRGFDNRHNSFTISNVAVSAQWDWQNLVGRVALQVGSTPSTYYAAEPSLAGSDGANATSASLWQYIQEAYVGYRFPVGRGLTVLGGIFLSPIGPEGMAIKDNWNWSRSNLFFGLPFYHTGLRLTYPLTDRWSVTLAGYNGWNSVVDNNGEKSVSAQVTYTLPERLAVSLLYFSGVERAQGALEGRAWRHLFDAHATWNVTSRLSLLAHANAGFEPNGFGSSIWVAGAAYARYQLLQPLYLAVRIDAFHEYAPTLGGSTAARIFWSSSWVTSQTATLDYRPHNRVSFRIEYRHDHAAGPQYFGGVVPVALDGVTFVGNRRGQDSLTLGVTGWL
ncbi:MAG: outer membrane beta-barrel protein [Myxococcaceae bacterium]